MKGKIKLIGIILLVLAFFAAGASWDVYRWKTFQEETNSDVGYFKWRFVIESGGDK